MRKEEIELKVNRILNSDDVLYVREYDLGNTYSGFQKISDPCEVLYYIHEDNKFLIKYQGGSNNYYKIVPIDELAVHNENYKVSKTELDLEDTVEDVFGHKNVIKGFHGHHEYIVKNLDNGIYNVIGEDMIKEVIYKG
jgi:hypothetical protein